MRSPARVGLTACLAAWLVCAAHPAAAADRPFLSANTAVAENDEEQVWAVENWYRRAGRVQSLTVAPEYAFDPFNSLQLEMRRVVRREDVGGHELELEYKHLFNSLDHDGWGWGVVATVDLERPQGGPWERRAVSVFVPLTLKLGEANADGLVHLNPAITKPRGERRMFVGAVAAEREVWRRTSLFGEIARDDDGRMVQLGLRHWIKRERLAVDIAWQRVRNNEQRSIGVVLGIAWHDL